MKENMVQALNFGGVLNADEIERIASAFHPRKLKPGEHFIRLGEVCKEIGFISQGVLRIYLLHDELEEATKYFLRRNQFVMDIRSFYDNLPADDGVQAVTEADLLVVSRFEWRKLTAEIPKLFILAKTLTETALLNKIKDNDYLHFGTARQKYEEFVRRYPDLALSVPLQYIASYLQITPQSLSRLRKNG